MTNDFTYRFTYCESCRYNASTGIECVECDKCSNHRPASDDSNCIKCKCLEQATDAKICPYYKENKMIVFDARMIYDEYKRQCLIKEDRFFTGENHHWMLRFHKCLQEEMENAGFICDKSWLNAIKPEEVRTEADNIEALDRGTFEW